jgi:hypothetical protein
MTLYRRVKRKLVESSLLILAGAGIAVFVPRWLSPNVNNGSVATIEGANPPNPAAETPVMVSVSPAPAAAVAVAPAPAAAVAVAPAPAAAVAVAPAPAAPAPVFLPEMAFGDPDTFDRDDYVYDEVVHFKGDPAVLDYNVRAASKNVVPGTLMWAERQLDGSTDVHLLAPNGTSKDTGIEWYNLRHEFYQCRQWGGPYTVQTSLNARQPFAAVKMPREMRYRAGSSKARP